MDRIIYAVRETIRINIKDNKKDLCGYFENKGRFYLSCRYYGVCLNEKIPDLKELDEEYYPLLFTLNSVRKNKDKKPRMFVEFSIPTLESLEAGIQEHKKDQRNSFVIFREGIGLNGEYLFNVLSFLGESRMYLYIRKDDSPVFYLDGENGDGVVMPYVHRRKE